MPDYKKLALQLHKKYAGKLEIKSKVPLKTKEDMSVYYTPGVAEPCKEIAKNVEDVYTYTAKGNTIVIVTDGSAVLGLGDIGPEAALPVMEGKAILFKEFANVDAIPICLDTQDADEIVRAVELIAPSFGGINLEDISAPRCFYIEEKLKRRLKIPVFHDDQHGTAIVVLAGLINALKIVRKKKSVIKLVVNGVGAAGVAIAKLLLRYGIKNIYLCDSRGVIYEGRREGMNDIKKDLAKRTNRQKIRGSLADAMKGSDVFIGVSRPNVVTPAMVGSMKADAIIFAMSNPDPEIKPELAKKAGARIIATGRSDYPNQINNVLAFPGVFRGVLDARAPQITEKMKIAAAEALASYVKKPREGMIVPSPLDRKVAVAVAAALPIED